MFSIKEEFSEQADDPGPIIQPFQEISALLERGPGESNVEPVNLNIGPVDYRVLCPVHKETKAAEKQDVDQQDDDQQNAASHGMRGVRAGLSRGRSVHFCGSRRHAPETGNSGK
jgi:hypothetical protein